MENHKVRPKRRRLRFFITALLAMGATVGMIAWQIRADMHREELNVALSNALQAGQSAEVKRLIYAGADPNIPAKYTPTQETLVERLKRILLRLPAAQKGTGLTALMVGAAYGDTEFVKHLLSRGANPNAGGSETPLYYAVADCANGLTPVPVPATASSAREVVRALLEAGANPNVQTEFEEDTAFQRAIRFKDDEMDHLFLKHGAKWDFQDRFDTTAFSDAVSYGRIALVRQMLAEGADANETENRHGVTVLEEAASQGYLEIARMLLDRGAKVNARGGQGKEYPLMWAAAEKGTVEMIQLLLERGADLDAKNYGGQTALDLARERGDKQVIQVLLDAAMRTTKHGKP